MTDHDEQLPPLGSGSMNVPYESNPEPYDTELQGNLSGGVVVIGATIEVDGVWRPALIFRFAIPDGSGFYPDMALVAQDDELKDLPDLAGSAAADAIAEAHKRRPGPTMTATDCPHSNVAPGERCPRCRNADEVGRPVGGGPRAATTIVARHNSNCPGCGRLIIAHQDRTGLLDDDWCCQSCVEGAT